MAKSEIVRTSILEAAVDIARQKAVYRPSFGMQGMWCHPPALKKAVGLLFSAAGRPPCITRAELESTITHACVSKELDDECRHTWLLGKLEEDTASTYTEYVELSDAKAPTTLDDVACFELPLSRGNDLWTLRLVMDRRETGLPSDFAAIEVRSRGATQRAFEEFVRDVERAAQSLWTVLRETNRGALSHVPLDAEDLQRERESFRRCLEIWITSPTDPLLLRVRSAMGMIIESDVAASSHTAVSLVLACSAIEALLVQNKNGITQQISRNAATLLEPRPEKRRDAIRSVAALYGDRSAFVHGGKLDEQPQAANEAWRLAAGALRAVMQWRRGEDQIDQTPSEESFFEAIEDSLVMARPMPHVESTLRDCLP